MGRVGCLFVVVDVLVVWCGVYGVLLSIGVRVCVVVGGDGWGGGHPLYCVG